MASGSSLEIRAFEKNSRIDMYMPKILVTKRPGDGRKPIGPCVVGS